MTLDENYTVGQALEEYLKRLGFSNHNNIGFKFMFNGIHLSFDNYTLIKNAFPDYAIINIV